MGIAFGPDVTRRWCTANKVTGIFRSHEVRQGKCFFLWFFYFGGETFFYCSCIIRSGCLLVRKQWFHPSFSAGADTYSTISPSTLVLQCPVDSAQPSCGTIHHWLDCGTRSLLLCQRAWTGFSLGELHQPNTFAISAVVLISSFVLIFNSVFY